MLKAAVAFFVGVYAIVFLALVAGLAIGLPRWLLGSAIFVMIMTPGLWLGLRLDRRRR